MKKSILIITAILFAISINAQVNFINNKVTGSNASALGEYNTSSGTTSFVSGYNSEASGNYSTALGHTALATGFHSVALGSYSKAESPSGTAIGPYAVVNSNATGAVAIGNLVESHAPFGFIIGGASNYNYPFINNISSSLMVGFQSDIPTFFVGSSSGHGTFGKVGIGTTDPVATLDVNGDLNFSGTLLQNGQEYKNSPWKEKGGNIYYKEGNIGIGTDAPNTSIHLSDKANPIIRLEKEGTYSSNVWDIENSFVLNFKYGEEGYPPETVFSFTRDGDFNFTGNLLQNGEEFKSSPWNTRSSDICCGDDSNVGIGTYDVMAKLHVNGNLYVSETAYIGSTNAHYTGTPTLTVQDLHNRGTLVLASGDDKPADFVFKSNKENRVWLTLRDNADDNDFRIYTAPDGSPVCRMTIEQNGNVGIGTTNPESKIHIKDGAIRLDGNMDAWTNTGWAPRIQSPMGTVWASTGMSNQGTADYYLGLGMTNSGWYFINRYEDGDYNYVAVIREDGRINCTEVVIEIDEWKDKVFEKDYSLLSIEETENYISEHGHLPNIPSEKEMIENGLETSEMIKLQMQKIEELTLYIIEMNKRIETLEKENKKLKNN